MTDRDTIITKLLGTLKIPKASGWHRVFDIAVKKGENPYYARFLADEYARLEGCSRVM